MTGASFAKWRGSPNHYQGRNGLHVDHITLHIMVGRLTGTDSCFMSSDFRAASHYGIGGDGSVYQWVGEENGSWADANWRSDCSGITIEHEGGMDGIPVTDAEVEASAKLCADIAKRYGWKTLWHDASGNRTGQYRPASRGARHGPLRVSRQVHERLAGGQNHQESKRIIERRRHVS